jgi:hypothetical protein
MSGFSGAVGYKPGDKVRWVNAPLTRVERLKLWLRAPWRIPPKWADREMIAVSVVSISGEPSKDGPENT